MRLSPYVALIILPGLLSLAGCSGTPAADGRQFRLPVFDAPQQWEPDIEGTPADGPPDL